VTDTEEATKVEPSDRDALHARQVEAMAGYGLPVEDIAQVLRMDVDELRRHNADELEDGRIKANSRVAENLFRKATGEGREAVVAAIFWVKTRAGWREVSTREVQSDVRYVVEMPEPCATAEEWLERYRPMIEDASRDSSA
jgi:hypothetical protein